jgi:thiol:disulfide interchange protein
MNKLIKFQWLIWLLAGMLLSFSSVKGQDTLSITGVQFSSSMPDTAQKVIKKALVVKPAAAVDVKKEKRSLWTIFIAGLIGGFAALLMPCIFPMLPLTVSYFTKGKDKDSAINKALLYGLSIIVIYVVLGLLVTIFFGADALNSLSTNGMLIFSFF